MGRLFVKELEGPVYTCKYCPDIGIAVYNPTKRRLPYFEYPASLGKLFYSYRCDNVVIGTGEVTIIPFFANNMNFETRVREVFCVACGSRIGLYMESRFGKVRYNEGGFYLNRFKLHGPPDGSDDDDPEVGENPE